MSNEPCINPISYSSLYVNDVEKMDNDIVTFDFSSSHTFVSGEEINASQINLSSIEIENFKNIRYNLSLSARVDDEIV